MLKYVIHEQIGNFSTVVFESEFYYEIQDYLYERFEDSGYDDEELFFSYFYIEEVNI